MTGLNLSIISLLELQKVVKGLFLAEQNQLPDQQLKDKNVLLAKLQLEEGQKENENALHFAERKLKLDLRRWQKEQNFEMKELPE